MNNAKGALRQITKHGPNITECHKSSRFPNVAGTLEKNVEHRPSIRKVKEFIFSLSLLMWRGHLGELSSRSLNAAGTLGQLAKHGPRIKKLY